MISIEEINELLSSFGIDVECRPEKEYTRLYIQRAGKRPPSNSYGSTIIRSLNFGPLKRLSERIITFVDANPDILIKIESLIMGLHEHYEILGWDHCDWPCFMTGNMEPIVFFDGKIHVASHCDHHTNEHIIEVFAEVNRFLKMISAL